MEEEEDESVLTPITPDDVQRWLDVAGQQLKRNIGATLPVAASRPTSGVGSESTYVDWLDAAIPIGDAFYPCCGSDLNELPRLFGPRVSTYHFADPFRQLGRRESARIRLRQISIDHIGNVVVGSSHAEATQIEGQPAMLHSKDGLLTLVEDIRSLSIFYYRGDSGGEGGSGQWVLGPVGFHCVLARLHDGGLICTDGSNAGYCDRENGKYAPWNALIGAWPFSPPVPGSSFEYFSRRFTCLTILERASPVYVWQVAGLALPPRK